MAVIAAPTSAVAPNFFHGRTHFKISSKNLHSFILFQQLQFKSNPISIFRSSSSFPHFSHLNPPFATYSATFTATTRTASNVELLLSIEAERQQPTRVFFSVLVWTSLFLCLFAAIGSSAHAAVASDSIRASSFGLKIASALRGSGWPDQAVVFALATLPVLELRGAIPVGYWMQLNPLLITFLAVLGNMVPVPFIVLYLKKLAFFLAGKIPSVSRFLDMLFDKAREKAGPVEEFQWLGLMLFVAVPFPGTGAWTGAIIASILEMPLLSAVSSNFVGVVFAGLLVNLLVNLGLKYAIITGIILFFISTFMWSVLRSLKKSLSSSN